MQGKESSSAAEVFTLLEECKTRIRKLEEQLEFERRRQATLENNLLGICKNQVTIHHLPDELLLQIFEEVKCASRIEPAAVVIKPIFLTCKNWHRIVTGSPTLWTSLSLAVLPDPVAIARDISYVKAYVRYSQSTPLNIRLELPLYRDLSSLISHMLGDPADPFPGNLRRDGHLYLQRIFARNEPESRRTGLFSDVNRALETLMFAIAGEGGVNLLRLRSIAISFHSREFCSWMNLNLFHHPTPILEEINILAIDQPPELTPIFIHPCPRLFHLSFNSSNTVEDSVVNMTSGQINRYSVSLTFSNKAFPKAAMAKNLKYLFVEFSYVEDFLLTGKPVLFPVLEELVYLNPCPTGLIQAPKLTTLHVLNCTGRNELLDQDCPFPSLQTLHIRSEDLDMEELNTYLTRTPSIKEVYLVATREEDIPPDTFQLVREGLTIRAYTCRKATSGEFYWSFASEVDIEPVDLSQEL